MIKIIQTMATSHFVTCAHGENREHLLMSHFYRYYIQILSSHIFHVVHIGQVYI